MNAGDKRHDGRILRGGNDKKKKKSPSGCWYDAEHLPFVLIISVVSQTETFLRYFSGGGGGGVVRPRVFIPPCSSRTKYALHWQRHFDFGSKQKKSCDNPNVCKSNLSRITRLPLEMVFFILFPYFRICNRN